MSIADEKYLAPVRADSGGKFPIASPLPARPAGAPAFETQWPVRLGDTDTDDRLRLDAVARYLQDIGFDNLDAVPEGNLHPAWIVRRTVVDVLAPIEFRDTVHLSRWSSGLSNRWCNMRVQIASERGGRIESEAFLININPETMRPGRMSDTFMAPMLAYTAEHRLRWRAALHARSDVSAEPRRFALRITDFDRMGHLNNAIYWAALEEAVVDRPDVLTLPYRAIVEHVGPVVQGDELWSRTWDEGSMRCVQLEVAGEARALARVQPLPA
ncbi:acyl-ACP thioesterase domain-containing protein [Skermania piniformis]|uniref:acyl-ACP thioesterase domain-containing protein n=1 Tax=Skermania pinensis TaxID=39122 RepID=UPI001FE7F676|nr:acyl-ACP thioesterase domain-containing protein [Skermania piniformis]